MATETRTYPSRVKAYEKKRDAAVAKGIKPPNAPKEPKQRIQEGEDRNFLRLATFLRILTGTSIDSSPSTMAKTRKLLQDYLLNFRQVGSHLQYCSDVSPLALVLWREESETKPSLGCSRIGTSA